MNIRAFVLAAALPAAIVLSPAAAAPKKPPAGPPPPPLRVTLGIVQTKGAPGERTMTATKKGALEKAAQVAWNYSTLWYWENNSYHHEDKNVCSINGPSLTFYIQHYECNSDYCLGGFGPNPYRWTVSLRRNGLPIWGTSFNTNAGWINTSVTLSTPLQSGTYDATVKLERRNLGWTTLFNQNTQPISFTAPANPAAAAPVPVIRLETVADPGSDMIYKLRGWQTNGNASLVGQWELYNSDPSGSQLAQIWLGWASPGNTLTIPANINLGSWYMLKYGNYSECFKWNETRRLVYIKK